MRSSWFSKKTTFCYSFWSIFLNRLRPGYLELVRVPCPSQWGANSPPVNFFPIYAYASMLRTPLPHTQHKMANEELKRTNDISAADNLSFLCCGCLRLCVKFKTWPHILWPQYLILHFKNSKNYRSDANQKPSFLQSVHIKDTNTLKTLTL